MVEARCCWAFSCTGSITAVDAIIRKREVIPLSKQQLLDCMFKHYPMPELEAKLDRRECFGLARMMGYKFAMEQGIMEEAKYHYIMERSNCKCPPDARIVKIDGCKVIDLDNTSEEEIERCIKRQPLTCSIWAFPSFQHHVGEEIYLGPTDEERSMTLTDEEEKLSHHALIIVGYGRENGENYYVVQNSWGKEWGYKGFAKIKKSLAMKLSYPVIKKEKKEE
ncbi:hypothetical protein H5410_044330 [Solanum commersonii]|uniref:Peptidase C1A papain C-terminal domain-containing protein n=1 Tax=Solanum commersonii TaxID=4109 RepID=A0A9J5XAJ5_SOLCO|nr:hypothetical protein H5410_044330 [Solanum commersonii]